MNELLGRTDTRDLRLKRTPNPEYICGPVVRRFKHGPAEIGDVKRLALLEDHAVPRKELEGQSKLTLKGDGVVDCVGSVQDVSQPRSIEVGEVDG
ncbi:hypothetical protein ACFPOA_15775 [Lysobacter niabensis]|uniref:hypothetical protein n=1 Tax=Agrilutibacter niabensis TaxID=380628 RepID=UPI003613AC93